MHATSLSLRVSLQLMGDISPCLVEGCSVCRVCAHLAESGGAWVLCTLSPSLAPPACKAFPGCAGQI